MRDLVDELLQAKVKARLFGGDHAPRLGRLVLLDRIGSGAMGTVFAAYDPRLDRKVAVKVLRAPDEARVLAEARALAKLAHPNVVAVHDVDEIDGAVVVVMELVTGVPLRTWIGGDHARADAVRVIREAAAGLAAAHRAGLVHRDVKPENILIGDDRTRVVDFGIATVEPGDELAGTPLYMAPEVLAGEIATAASDQFALGVTFFEALYGERPYTGAKLVELSEASRHAVDAVATKPASWEARVVARALAAEPADRFPSLDALIAELDRDRRRRRRTVAIAVPSLAAVAVVALFAFRSHAADDRCSGADRRARSWSAEHADRVRAALGSGGWATTAVANLDASGSAWEASFRHVCEATRVRGDQSDALLELRMRCLDRAIGRLDALVAGFGSAPVQRFEVSGAIAELPSAAACETLVDAHELALPADPTKRALAVAAERDLDGAWAAYALGRYPDARTRVAAIDLRTADLDAPSLRAQVLVLAASIEARTSSPAAARAALDKALDAAAHADAAGLELDVWSRLLRQELFAGDPAHVVEWSPFAHAAATRAGLDGAELDGIVGQALREGGKLSAARDRLRHALASHDPLRGDQRALVEMNLGSVELAAGDFAAAEAQFTKALADATSVLGDGHPSLAIYLDKLAAVDRAHGNIAAALARHDQSLALRTTAFGPDDRAVATSLVYRADTLREAGRLADATADLERARTIRAKVYGDHSSRLGEIDAGLADIAAADGRTADARSLYAAALAALGPAPTVTRLRLLRGLARVDPSYGDAARQLASTMPDVAP